MRKKVARSCFKKRFYFYKKDEGTTLLEFAILAPVFILLMFGTIHMGMMMVIQNALEAAVREASRYGVTGASQTNMTRGDSILQVIRNTAIQYSGGIIKTNDLVVTVSAYPNLVNVSADNGQTGSYGTGGQAVLYKLSYTWDTLFTIFGNSNLVTLHAQTPVVNELFTSS
ncbi:MAG: TadE/TadG family type IV pilus assembly protein [Janthinobacterium lividum]